MCTIMILDCIKIFGNYFPIVNNFFKGFLGGYTYRPHRHRVTKTKQKITPDINTNKIKKVSSIQII